MEKSQEDAKDLSRQLESEKLFYNKLVAQIKNVR
jgi:hypothetical protein